MVDVNSIHQGSKKEELGTANGLKRPTNIRNDLYNFEEVDKQENNTK